MQVIVSNFSNEAPPTRKGGAWLDRRMKNSVNRSLYTDKQSLLLEKVKIGLGEVIEGTIYPVSYDKKTAYVKVAIGYRITDGQALKLLEADWAKEGVWGKVTPKGTMYKLTR
jgi:hypothetical protein